MFSVLEVVVVVLFCEETEPVVLDDVACVVVFSVVCVVVFAVVCVAESVALSTRDVVVVASEAAGVSCFWSALHPTHASSIAATPMIDKIFFIHTLPFYELRMSPSIYHTVRSFASFFVFTAYFPKNAAKQLHFPRISSILKRYVCQMCVFGEIRRTIWLQFRM